MATMDAARIEERLRLGEDSRTEFKGVAKKNFDIDVDDLAREIAALANSGGGHILVGIENDGMPSGVGTQAQADALMRKASQACRDRVRPAIGCEFTKVAVRDVVVLVIEVPGFTPDRPFLVHGRLHIRDGTQTQEGTGADMRRIAQSVSYHFDEQPVRGATLDEIDLRTVEEFLTGAYERGADPGEVPRYLRALGCLDLDDTPTVTGILFFGRTPQRWLPDARVSAVRLPGTEPGGEFLDRREIEGRLTEQFSAAAAFLSDHLGAPSRVEGWERRELGIPAEVLREALLNALAHRDYHVASQTRVFVYDDRVEIGNPGELLNRLTLDSISLGVSQRRNPRIG
jgi:ATP-dependent DNA helicase RecG